MCGFEFKGEEEEVRTSTSDAAPPIAGILKAQGKPQAPGIAQQQDKDGRKVRFLEGLVFERGDMRSRMEKGYWE